MLLSAPGFMRSAFGRSFRLEWSWRFLCATRNGSAVSGSHSARDLHFSTRYLSALTPPIFAVKKQIKDTDSSLDAIIEECTYMEEQVEKETRKNVEMSLEELTEVIRLSKSGKHRICIVDIRDTEAVVKSGMIPGAINIPVSSLKTILPLKPEDFKEQTQCTFKPFSSDSDSYFLFYGEGPNQAMTALEIAYRYGFKNARVFPGGWKAWLAVEEEAAK